MRLPQVSSNTAVVTGPIDTASLLASARSDACGALACFVGVVRDLGLDPGEQGDEAAYVFHAASAATVSVLDDSSKLVASFTGAGGTEIVAPKRPQCPPEQKQKVMNSINAYVQAAQAPPPPQGSPPAP